MYEYIISILAFRFYGRIAKEANNHEAETLRAIRENALGLERISGERIWTELKKILEGNYAGDLMLTIVENGIAPYIGNCFLIKYLNVFDLLSTEYCLLIVGLPKDIKTDELLRVWKRSGHLKLNAITLLSSLLNSQDDVLTLNARLKLSAFERELCIFVVEHSAPKLHPKPLMPFQQLVVKSKSKPLDTKKMAVEVLKYNNSPYIEEFERWDIPKFPVSGNMLKEHGIENGRFMGSVITELKHYWAENDFNLDTDELLKHVPRVLQILEKKKKKTKNS